MNCTTIFKNYNTGASSRKVPVTYSNCTFSPSLHLHTALSHADFGINANSNSIRLERVTVFKYTKKLPLILKKEGKKRWAPSECWWHQFIIKSVLRRSWCKGQTLIPLSPHGRKSTTASCDTTSDEVSHSETEQKTTFRLNATVMSLLQYIERLIGTICLFPVPTKILFWVESGKS